MAYFSAACYATARKPFIYRSFFSKALFLEGNYAWFANFSFHEDPTDHSIRRSTSTTSNGTKCLRSGSLYINFYNYEWVCVSYSDERYTDQTQQRDQASSGIEHLLKALWHSEFLCRFNLYRTAIILLADIGLEFGITRRSRQILEEIMPQVSNILHIPYLVLRMSKIINGDDLEQRAVACFTLARCIIVAEGSTRKFFPWISKLLL